MLESHQRFYSSYKGFGNKCLFFTSDKIFYFSQVNVFIACHLSKIYLQLERKRGFIWSQTFDFLLQKPSNIYSEKKSCSLKVAVFNFLGTPLSGCFHLF